MELLTVKETAKILRVSPITVRRYIASGRLAAERVGRGIRIRREAIEELVTPIVSQTNTRESHEVSRNPSGDSQHLDDNWVEIWSPSSPDGSVWVHVDKLDEYLDERGVGEEDPVWDLVGMGRSDGPNDVARNKHRYLAEAILASCSDEPMGAAADSVELPTMRETLGISVGIGRSGEPTNIAEHKDEYLADAFEVKG